MGKTYIISDTHLNHDKIKTYCRRPDNFTELIDKNVHMIVKPGDCLIHDGDVGISKPESFMPIVAAWPGHKILVRGNHDQKSCQYYMDHGFDFACDALLYRGVWFTHKPSLVLPDGAHINIHGHLHNVWDGFLPNDPEAGKDEFSQTLRNGKLPRDFNRLFAVEYTNYSPVEMDKFVAKPDKYLARGPIRGVENGRL